MRPPRHRSLYWLGLGVGRGGALDGRRLRQVPATLEYRHSFEGFSGGEPWRPGD